MDTIVLKLKDAVDNPNLKRIGELSYKWKGNVNVNRPDITVTGGAIWIDGSLVNSLSNVDWTVDHVISISKDYLLTLTVDRATFCDFDLSEFSCCNDITNIYITDSYSVQHGELGTITGDISSLANLDKLESLMLAHEGRIRGNLESLGNTSLGRIEIHSSLIEGDVAKLPSTTYSLTLYGSGSPYFLAYERIPVTYSSQSLRADSSNKSITVRGAVFASSDDVNNYLIATSNCAFAGNTNKKIDITCKGTFTPSEDALAAIQNLKTNMYSAVGDSERTAGAYYTSIKVNNTDY